MMTHRHRNVSPLQSKFRAFCLFLLIVLAPICLYAIPFRPTLMILLNIFRIYSAPFIFISHFNLNGCMGQYFYVSRTIRRTLFTTFLAVVLLYLIVWPAFYWVTYMYTVYSDYFHCNFHSTLLSLLKLQRIAFPAFVVKVDRDDL